MNSVDVAVVAAFPVHSTSTTRNQSMESPQLRLFPKTFSMLKPSPIAERAELQITRRCRALFDNDFGEAPDSLTGT